MREKERLQSFKSEMSLRTALLGILLLAGVFSMTVLSLQPLNSAILRVIMIYVFLFLSSGMMVAAVINRFMDKKRNEASL